MKTRTQILITVLMLLAILTGCAAPIAEPENSLPITPSLQVQHTESKPTSPPLSTEATEVPESSETEASDDRQEETAVPAESEWTEPPETLPLEAESQTSEPMPVEQTEPLEQTEPTQPPAETKPAETQPPARKPTEPPKETEPAPTTPTPTQPKPTEPKPTEPIITVESSETPLAPTEQTTELPTAPTESTSNPTEPPTTSTEPITAPAEPTTEPTDPEPEPLTAQMLRELEQAGLNYAVNQYGYEVDYSLGFGAVCGYYPGMSGYFNADGYDNLLSLVKTNVDVTTDYLMGQSGPIWGYREDNGQVWRTLINIAIVDDGGGSYTVWVFYG